MIVVDFSNAVIKITDNIIVITSRTDEERSHRLGILKVINFTRNCYNMVFRHKVINVISC